MHRFARTAFVVLFVLVVSGLTWLAVLPMKWIIETYGLMAGAAALPVFFVIALVAMKRLEGSRH